MFKLKALIITLGLTSTLLSSLGLAQDLSSVAIKTIPVASNVYMLMGKGGNIGVLVGDDGAMVVDDQFAPLVPKIKDAIIKLNPRPIRFVLNTHWHQDHTGGNEALGAGGSIIVAHENVRKRLSTEQFSQFMNKKYPPRPAQALPVITFDKDISFHWNGERVLVKHFQPGHTDGDSIVYFSKAKVIHMGDLYFNGFYPYIDAGSGGKVEGMIRSIDQVLQMVPPDTKVIPGHGPLSNMEELKAYQAMLVTIKERVKKLKKQGKKLEEIITSKPSADLDAKWGGGFMKPDQFITVVFHSL